MSRRQRRTTSLANLDDVFAASPRLRAMHEMCIGQGMEISGAYVWRSTKGSLSARVIWRKRDSSNTSTAMTVSGLLADGKPAPDCEVHGPNAIMTVHGLAL